MDCDEVSSHGSDISELFSPQPHGEHTDVTMSCHHQQHRHPRLWHFGCSHCDTVTLQQLEPMAHSNQSSVCLFLFVQNHVANPCQEPCEQQTAASASELGLSAALILLIPALFQQSVRKKREGRTGRTPAAVMLFPTCCFQHSTWQNHQQ